MIPIGLPEALKFTEIEGCTVAPVYGEFMSPDKEREPDLVVPDTFEAQRHSRRTASYVSIVDEKGTLDQAGLELLPGYRFFAAFRPIFAAETSLLLARFAG
jgi:hypothetical protein